MLDFSLYFHISKSDEISVLEPRIPLKLWAGFEDDTIKRICFGIKIEDCLKALYATENSEYKVYIPTFIVSKSNVYKPTNNDVIDAEYTNEVWVTKPISVKSIGTIVVDEVIFDEWKQAKDVWVPTYTYKYSLK